MRPVVAASPPTESVRSSVWWRVGGGLALALLVLVGIGFFRGPAGTLAALHEAARARDSAAMARLIDGEALRHSLGRLLLQQTGAALPDDGGNDRQLLSQFDKQDGLEQEVKTRLDKEFEKNGPDSPRVKKLEADLAKLGKERGALVAKEKALRSLARKTLQAPPAEAAAPAGAGAGAGAGSTK